jgi:type I restriction enzyme S subunit
MAQMIYREWFVHFRFPGHEKVKMVDSPLEKFPEGWEIGRLDDAIVLQRGFDLPKKKREQGEVPVYAATDAVGSHNEYKVKGPGVVTGRSGSLGSVIYIDENYWPLNTTLWIKEFKRFSPLYAYYQLSGMELNQFNSGAAVPTLNRNDIHGLLVRIPDKKILDHFDDYVLPIFKTQKNMKLKNKNLRETRDLLLPKLISGEIEI